MAPVDANHGFRAHITCRAAVTPATTPGTLCADRPGDPAVLHLLESPVGGEGLAGTWQHSSSARVVVGARPDRGAGTFRVDAKSNLGAIAGEAGQRMRIIDRYIIGTILLYSAMVLGVLLTLGGLFVFIGQQDDIGVGSYRASDALLFTVLNIPQQAFELMPIAVLIGGLFGLGILARGSELVVVRAAGVSVARIAVSAAIAGLLIAILTALLGEVVAPPMQKFARQQKAFSKFSDVSFAGSGSAWVKDGNTIISVHEQSGDNLFGGVYVFRFANPRLLISVGHASRAILGQTAGHWQLDGYTETRFEDDQVVTTPRSKLELETKVNPGFLGIAASEPRQLPSIDLWRLINHLRAN